MKNLIKTGLWAMLSVSLLFVSCTNNEKDCKTLSQDFLDAYFQNEYQQAMSFCDEALSAELEKALKQFECLDSTVQEDLKAKSAEVTTEILEVKILKENKNYCIVKYNVLIPEVKGAVTNSLILEKKDNEWKITALNV